jgi:hypothetical protein
MITEAEKARRKAFLAKLGAALDVAIPVLDRKYEEMTRPTLWQRVVDWFRL